MDVLRTGAEVERQPEIIVAVPAGELLQDPLKAAKTWQEYADLYPSFLTQVEAHQLHTRVLHEVMDALPHPTTTVEQGVANGHLTIEQATNFYDTLRELISNPDSSRILLYLPFEFLPAVGWEPEDNKLYVATQEFREEYYLSWRSMLLSQEVRANFVDGDVLEPELRNGDVERVVKATHLIPKLLELGMLTSDEVIDAWRNAQEPLLRRNLGEMLVVCEEARLLDVGDHEFVVQAQVELDKIAADEAAVRARIEAEGTSPYATERRQLWLWQQEVEAQLARSAKYVGNAIVAGTPADESIAELLLTDKRLTNQVRAEGILNAIEQAARTGAADPQAIHNRYLNDLTVLWNSDDPQLKPGLAKAFRHLHRLGLVDQDYLSELGVIVPNLSGPLSENLAFMPEEIDQLKDVVAKIENDPELAEMLYPVVAVYGSRLKGYGEQHSDLDVGIFVRPEVPVSRQDLLRGILKTKLELDDEPLEFWLEESANLLSVRDLSQENPHMADSYWTHMLFGAAWVGHGLAVAELQQRLLPSYFHDVEEEDGFHPRQFYLERLEQDLLQYRLMHKGYDRHYPRYTELGTPRPELIDGHSAFWDAGFRRIATKLFADMVFLPNVD